MVMIRCFLSFSFCYFFALSSSSPSGLYAGDVGLRKWEKRGGERKERMVRRGTQPPLLYFTYEYAGDVGLDEQKWEKRGKERKERRLDPTLVVGQTRPRPRREARARGATAPTAVFHLRVRRGCGP